MIRRRAIFLSAALILSACRPDVAAVPDPVPMTAEAVGYFCQMNLLEHEGPKAQVHLKSVMHPLFFSQVRDAIAYQRMPEQSDEIIGIYVNDMGAPGASWAAPGADNWILAGDAVYVTGSRQRGAWARPSWCRFPTLTRPAPISRNMGASCASCPRSLIPRFWVPPTTPRPPLMPCRPTMAIMPGGCGP